MKASFGCFARLSAVLVLLGSIAAIPSMAQTVTIINPSFEFVDNVSGCSSGNVLDSLSFLGPTFYSGGCVDSTPFGTVAGSSGWTVTGPDAGVLNWSSLFVSIPDGTNVAYINTGTIFQTLGTDAAVGTYTLSLDVGGRCDHPINNYTVELLAGTNPIATDNGSLVSSLTGAGQCAHFLTDTLIANVTSSTPGLGDPLEIMLSASEPGGPPPILPTAQANFDQVTLDGPSAIPEPSTLTLFGSGLLAMAYLFRRKRPWRCA